MGASFTYTFPLLYILKLLWQVYCNYIFLRCLHEEAEEDWVTVNAVWCATILNIELHYTEF